MRTQREQVGLTDTVPARFPLAANMIARPVRTKAKTATRSSSIGCSLISASEITRLKTARRCVHRRRRVRDWVDRASADQVQTVRAETSAITGSCAALSVALLSRPPAARRSRRSQIGVIVLVQSIQVIRLAITFSPSGPSPSGRIESGRVKGRGTRGKLPLRRPAGMLQSNFWSTHSKVSGFALRHRNQLLQQPARGVQ